MDHLVGQGIVSTTATMIARQVVDAVLIVDLPSITFNENYTLTDGDPYQGTLGPQCT